MATFIPFIPKGQINVYRFVPLDETYQNTLHFETREQQLAYFGCNEESTGYEDLLTPRANTIDKVRLVGQSFTRNERQYVRIEGNACNYYDCNYMAYQNRDFGQMWFFAFVHEVIYANDYCTELQFEIDVMQTFMWNYELRECFVEREHTLTDGLYEHLEPEPMLQYPFKNTDIVRSNHFNTWCAVLGTAFDLPITGGTPFEPETINDPTKPVMHFYNSIPVGGCLTVYQLPSELPNMQRDLDDIYTYRGGDGIFEVILFPYDFAEYLKTGTPDEITISVQRPTDIDGYVPINKRLFSYPYSYIHVDSNTTESVYKFELFDEGNPSTVPRFNLDPCVAGIPVINCKPANYDRKGGGTDLTKRIAMTNFPQIQISQNNFQQWWGQNSWNEGMKLVTGIAEIGIGIGAGNINVGLAGATTALSSVSDYITASTTPATVKIPQGVYADISDGSLDFYFKTVQICAEGAKATDDFFTMYGYAVNRVKVPNIRNYSTCRPHFNYIKCREMSFHWELFMSEGKGTSVPQYYMKKIISIYQNGITFWKNPNEVGRYDSLKAANVPQ